MLCGGAQTEDKTKKDKFVLSVAYSLDGSKLACGCMDGTVAIFDVNTGSLLSTCAGHFKPVRSVAFTPGGPWSPVSHQWFFTPSFSSSIERRDFCAPQYAPSVVMVHIRPN